MIHCKTCGREIGGGLHCNRCRNELAAMAAENDMCTCVRQGDFEDVRGCDVHDPRKQRSWNDD
jgi:hypothetical protein